MAETQNLQLDELDADAPPPPPADARPQNAKELEAVYDIPVQSPPCSAAPRCR